MNIERVVVVGCGLMGSGIVEARTRAGLDVSCAKRVLACASAADGRSLPKNAVGGLASTTLVVDEPWRWRGQGALAGAQISNVEGNRLLVVVRRSSGSVVNWRRVQMVLLSAQGMDVEQGWPAWHTR